MRARLLPLLLLAACAGDPATPHEPAGPELVSVDSAEAIVDDLDALAADAVVLNLWATWCGPCRVEFPDLVALDREREADGVEVRFVSLDDPDETAAVRAFLAEHDVQDPAYLYTGTADLAQQFDPFLGAAVPITIVLDGDGIVQATKLGVVSRDELDALVDRALDA